MASTSVLAFLFGRALFDGDIEFENGQALEGGRFIGVAPRGVDVDAPAPAGAGDARDTGDADPAPGGTG